MENKWFGMHSKYLKQQMMVGIDGGLLVEPPALVLVFIYQARLNAIYTAELS